MTHAFGRLEAGAIFQCRGGMLCFAGALCLAGVLCLAPSGVAQTPAPTPALVVELEAGPAWQSYNDVEIPNDGTATRFSLVDLAGHFPTSGYVHELDIYLDSAWEDLSFIYAASVRLLDGNGCFGGPFCYSAVEVGQTGDGLLVNGHEVTRAGWYTFRFHFSEENGGLEVEFELRPRSGPTVYTEAITESSFEERDLSTFDISNVGSGYSWFAFITPGLELPIDEQRIRPGK